MYEIACALRPKIDALKFKSDILLSKILSYLSYLIFSIKNMFLLFLLFVEESAIY